MIKHILTSYENYIYKKCDAFTEKKYWIATLTVLLPLISLFFAFPAYDGITTEFSELWKAIFRQIDNPFKEYSYDPYSHEAKTTFRLFVPLVAKVLHLNIAGILIMQAVFGAILFYMSAKIFLRLTDDKTSSLLLTLALAFIWTGRTSVSEIRAMFDGISIFFLVFSIYYKNPLLIFIGIFFSSWTDERGLIASSLVFLFWSYYPERRFTFFNKQTIAIITAWLAYFAIRFYMSFSLHLTTYSDYVGFSVFREQINNLPIGLWSALEGFWIIVLLSLIVLFKTDKKLYSFFIAIAVSIVLIVAMSVHDITRSMAYVFPVVFISILILKEQETPFTLKKLSLVAASVSFIYPAYDTTGDYYINWVYPLPLQILRLLYGTGEVLGNI
jgi:hypothetical protein